MSLNFSITEGNFMITDKAAAKINELIVNEGRNNQALHIKITPGGCAGFSYDMGWIDVNANGRKFVNSGAIVIIGEADLRLIDGGELDYTESLMGSKFEIKNPNASNTCGCGKSWS